MGMSRTRALLFDSTAGMLEPDPLEVSSIQFVAVMAVGPMK